MVPTVHHRWARMAEKLAALRRYHTTLQAQLAQGNAEAARCSQTAAPYSWAGIPPSVAQNPLAIGQHWRAEAGTTGLQALSPAVGRQRSRDPHAHAPQAHRAPQLFQGLWGGSGARGSSADSSAGVGPAFGTASASVAGGQRPPVDPFAGAPGPNAQAPSPRWPGMPTMPAGAMDRKLWLQMPMLQTMKRMEKSCGHSRGRHSSSGSEE